MSVTQYSIEDLQHLMSRLRDPKDGCPWDKEQTFASIVPHTLEESYELADAITKNDLTHIKEELGDVLFQVIFTVNWAVNRGPLTLLRLFQS